MMGQYSVVANCAILTLLSFLCLVIIWRQPQTREIYSFKVGLNLVVISLFIHSLLLITNFITTSHLFLC